MGGTESGAGEEGECMNQWRSQVDGGIRPVDARSPTEIYYSRGMSGRLPADFCSPPRSLGLRGQNESCWEVRRPVPAWKSSGALSPLRGLCPSSVRVPGAQAGGGTWATPGTRSCDHHSTDVR